MKKQNEKGFTLIELLVVIAIIGLLSTLAVVSLNNARSKSRDARRVADVKQMQTALELYFNDVGNYPAPPAALACGPVLGDTGSCCISFTSGIASPCAGTVYMKSIPLDPDNTAHYSYSQLATDTYSLVYTLDGPTGGIPAATHCATPAGIWDDGGLTCP